MNHIEVVGVTDQRKCYIVSREKSFRINEFLIIEDLFRGNLVCQVLETNTYNKFIPMSMTGEIADKEVLENLRNIGIDIDQETIYFGVVRLMREADYPIETGSNVRTPTFEEVHSYFIATPVHESLQIGVIRNTDKVYETMDNDLKDLCMTFEDQKLQRQKEVPYFMGLYSMQEYPHVGIFGGSGSGKSFGMRVILEELMQKEIPGIVLDPHFEMDFTNKIQKDYGIDYTDQFQKFEIGKNIGIEFTKLNTTELKHIIATSASLTESMQSSIEVLHKPKETATDFKQRIDRLLDGYTKTEEKLRVKIEMESDPGIKEDLQKTLDILLEYGNRCVHSSVQGVSWRFNRVEASGIFNSNLERLETAIKHRKLCVIQGSIRLIQVFSTYIMNKFYTDRKDYRESIINNAKEVKEYFPPFFIITDECHNFVPANVELKSKAILREIAQEGRKYGVFLILATQRPSLVDPTVTAQLNTKLIFRTTRSSDISTISEETDLSVEEMRRLPYLNTGDAFISQVQAGRSMYIRIRAAHTDTPHKDNPFDELNRQTENEILIFKRNISDFLPINEMNISEVLRKYENVYGVTLTVDQFEKKMNQLVRLKAIKKEDLGLGVMYDKI